MRESKWSEKGIKSRVWIPVSWSSCQIFNQPLVRGNGVDGVIEGEQVSLLLENDCGVTTVSEHWVEELQR